MEIIKEQKLTESKEKLPISFLTDFVSKGWEEVGYLKADIEAIKEAYSGTKLVEELIQNLIDAYLVCVGQMELHIHDNNYLEYPEESGLGGGEIKEALKEDVDIHIEGNEVHIADDSGEEVATIPVESEGEAVPEEEPVEEIAADDTIPPVEANIERIKEPLDDPFVYDGPEAEGVRKFEKPEVADFFVDFDDPVGEPVTEKELYGEGEEELPRESLEDAYLK